MAQQCWIESDKREREIFKSLYKTLQNTTSVIAAPGSLISHNYWQQVDHYKLQMMKEKKIQENREHRYSVGQCGTGYKFSFKKHHHERHYIIHKHCIHHIFRSSQNAAR